MNPEGLRPPAELTVNNLFHFIQAGGFVMYPLVLFSLASITIIVERILAYRQLGNLAPGLLPDVLKRVRAGDLSGALSASEARTGPVAACLTVALRNREKPVAAIERQVEETGQEYFLRLERFLPFLDTTTTISPLLGLLGTIVGMIGTFNAIAGQEHRENSDAVLAGVGEALYATATGLVVAVVCFVAYNFFAARQRTIIGETEQAVTKLLNVLADSEAVEKGR